MKKPEKPVDVVKATSAKVKGKTALGARSTHKNSDWYETAKKAVAIIGDEQVTEHATPRTPTSLRRGKHA